MKSTDFVRISWVVKMVSQRCFFFFEKRGSSSRESWHDHHQTDFVLLIRLIQGLYSCIMKTLRDSVFSVSFSWWWWFSSFFVIINVHFSGVSVLSWGDVFLGIYFDSFGLYEGWWWCSFSVWQNPEEMPVSTTSSRQSFWEEFLRIDLESLAQTRKRATAFLFQFLQKSFPVSVYQKLFLFSMYHQLSREEDDCFLRFSI